MTDFIAQVRNFLKRPFVRDSLILQVGTLFGTGLSILTSIIIARLLGVITYGEYALLGALLGVLTIFTDAGMDSAGLTKFSEAYEKKEREPSENILAAYLKVSALFIVGIGFLLVLFAPFIAGRFYGNAEIGQLARWWLVGNMFLIPATFVILVLQAKRFMKSLVAFEAVGDFSKSLGKIVFLLAGYGLLGVVFGQLIAAIFIAVLSVMLYARLYQKDSFLPRWGVLLQKSISVNIKKFLRFGIGISLNKNLGNFTTLLPVLFLGYFAAPAEAGFYRIAFSYTTLPYVLLGGVSRLMGVQYPQSLAHGAANLRQKFLKSSFYAGLISIGLLVLFVLAGPFLVQLVYGSEYSITARLILPLAITLLPVGFTVGMGSIYRALDIVRINTALGIVFLIASVVLVYFLLPILSPLRIVFVVMGILNYTSIFVHFPIVLQYLNKEIKREALLPQVR